MLEDIKDFLTLYVSRRKAQFRKILLCILYTLFFNLQYSLEGSKFLFGLISIKRNLEQIKLIRLYSGRQFAPLGTCGAIRT